jgi:hypothetical protein
MPAHHPALRRATIAVALAATVGLVGAGATPPGARGGDPPACPTGNDPTYVLTTRALTGPARTDVELKTAPEPGCAAVEEAKHVKIKIFDADGKVEDVRNFVAVQAQDGVLPIELGRVERGRRIEAEVLVQTGTPPRTVVLHDATTSRLRPDLVVQALHLPPQTLTTRPVDVVVDVDEVNGDTGAAARVQLRGPLGPLADPLPVDVQPNGSASVTFHDVALKTAAPTELKVVVADAVPGEYDPTNGTRTTTVDVTEHQLASPRTVLFPSLVGYGAQFGNHLYAPITPWPVNAGYGDVEAKVKALEPQLVRIFYNDNWDGNWTTGVWTPTWEQNYASFVKSVQLAQEAGATIDISFQNLGTARLPAVSEPAMVKFADVLEILVRHYGLTNVRWAEVGNEPNTAGGAVTLDDYERLVRALHAQLVARGLRDQIKIMGGGLIESSGDKSHYNWMKEMAERMSDVVDSYAEHIYWWYDRPGRLEYRLRDTAHLMNDVLPVEQRKPQYMMEFGIRGYNSCEGKPTLGASNHLYYRDADCTDIWRTNIAAFQQLWFNIDSAQLGVAGTSKWDAYWSMYDRSSPNNQLYWMIGPPTEGSPVTPTYNAFSLLFHVTVPGWQIVRVEPWESNDWTVPTFGAIGAETSSDQPEQELAGYAGPSGELTIMGIDTNGRDLNTVSSSPPSKYSIGGLPANTAFTLAIWNATGDGSNSIAGTVTTNAAGVARFEVPLQGAFALTTVPVE